MNSENKKSILLVEDEAIIAMTEKITLEKYGYKVFTANSGEEAVSTVAKTPAIDLVLMDINLGSGIDGTEAAEIILRQRDLPIVFLSSHIEPEVVEKTEKITSYGYVVKSSSDTVLQASIKMAFKLFESILMEKEKERALSESEEKYRTLVEMANEAIVIAQNGVIVFANRKTTDLLGISAGNLESKPFIDFIWSDDREKVMESYRRRISGETVPDAYDFRIIGKGGLLTWFFPSAATIQWKGKTATLNLLTDITVRKHAEEALRASKALYQALVETSPDAIALSDQDGVIIMVNEQMIKLHGYESKQELNGKSAFELFAPVERHRVADKKLNGASEVQSGGIGKYEYILQRKDGTRFWGELYSKLILSPVGKLPLILTIVRDITERKQAEEALRESEARLRHLVESSNDLVWETDANGITTYVSDKIVDLLGYTPEEVIGKTSYDLMPSKDAEKARAAFGPLFAQRKAFRGIENINLHKNGHQVVMESNGVPVFDENGEFRGYCGMDKKLRDGP